MITLAPLSASGLSVERAAVGSTETEKPDSKLGDCLQGIGLRQGQGAAYDRGHALMQLEQLTPFLCQKSLHFSPSTGHLSTPGFVDGFKATDVFSPFEIAPAGHAFTHLRHLSHRSAIPKVSGLSDSRGISVKILQILNREPSSGVARRPFLPNSPKPESMARGMLRAVSFPHPIARHPRCRTWPIIPVVINAILAYPFAVAASARGEGDVLIIGLSISTAITMTVFISSGTISPSG